MPYKDPEKQKEARRKYEEKQKEARKQRKDFWLFIFYPDSAPENWKEIITEWQAECIVSPLHDKDVDPNGKPKKPHWHGILFFDSQVTKDFVADIIKPLNGPVPIRPVGSKRSACRYLIHADNPDKYQYEQKDLLEFAGASYQLYTIQASDTETFVSEMIEWIEKYRCYSYRILLQYAREYRPEWFQVLCRSATYVIKEYMKSAFQEIKAAQEGFVYSEHTLEQIVALETVDPQTGEIQNDVCIHAAPDAPEPDNK